MNLTHLLLFVLLAAAAAAAWSVGGALGTGIFAGALCGGSLAALGAGWQQLMIRTRPQRALAASVEVFLVKLVCLLGSALALHFVPQAAARVDLRSYVVAFAAAAFIVMIAGTFETARALRGARPAGTRVLGGPTLGERGTL